MPKNGWKQWTLPPTRLILPFYGLFVLSRSAPFSKQNADHSPSSFVHHLPKRLSDLVLRVFGDPG